MTKAFKLNWHKEVPDDLRQGVSVLRWTEDGDIEPDCLVKVDDCGFFIFWKCDTREGDVLELSQVNDIRQGKLPQDIRVSSSLKSKAGDDWLDRSVTVCSGLDMVNITLCHFVFPSVQIAEIWKTELRKLTNNVKINNVCPKTNLEKHWKRLRMTTTVDGNVSVRAVAKTFASGKTEKLVYQTLAECDFPSGKTDSIELSSFTFEKFYQIYKILCPRIDIDELFLQITGGKCDEISVDKLIEFLNEKQRDPRLNEILYPHYNEQRVKEIISEYEEDQALVKQGVISKEGLTNYLMSDENAPVFLDRLDIYQDMDQPLPHYYINSSHNTYLTGRQFGGRSSVEMYRQVLLAGCRCVELDCWDGKDSDNEPIITHGRAMCTEIPFKDVIYAIRDCAFVTSDYPLILSFENHCSRQQQYKMAKYCDEIFGDLLLKEPLPDFPLTPGTPLPSPVRLLRKILIKNKRLRPEMEEKELEMFWRGELAIEENEEDKEDPRESAHQSSSGSNAGPPGSLEAGGTGNTNSPSLAKAVTPPSSTAAAAAGTPAAASATTAAGSSAASSTTGSVTGSTPALPTHTIYQGSTLNVHPYLSSMVVYTQPMKFQGFEFADQDNIASKMSSFPETTALGYLKTQAIEFVNYNKRQLSRIYPKGSRVDSSNFMPQIFWNSGCQLVSLNFQTPDLPMQLNQGKFEYNGNCGYLLKPDFMRRHDKEFDPFAETPVDGVIAAQCSVKVISGQFLSDKKVGTYVEVDMYGLPTDTIRKENRTKVVQANGLNPIYNEETFVFRKVVLPELAVLRFAVYDDNGKMLGQRILPFEDLQAGYRHIALRTEGNFPMSLPMLFCNIELKVYIPEGLSDFMDALSDPRAFLSNQEKRAEQLKAMGIDESDISTKDVILAGGNKIKASAMAALPGVPIKTTKKKEEKDEFKFEPITADSLKQEKGFVKVMKKHMKELDTMRKKHMKERTSVQKTQCAAIEKLVKSKGKDNDVVNDPTVKHVVVDQTKQWSEMMERHRKEEWELMKQQLKAQEEVLKKLMEAAQATQIKELEVQFEIENKEMRASQARKSVEVAKDIQTDKTLKSKAEKERILKEKQSMNTKMFIEERKKAAFKQAKRREKLKKNHDNQMNDLLKYMQTSLEMYKNEEIEYQLAAKQECFV